MEYRSKRPMLTFAEVVLISVPLIPYFITGLTFLLLPLPAAILYSVFGAFARHHENQPLVEPKKLKLYQKLHEKLKLGLVISFSVLEFVSIYISTMGL